MDDIDALRLAKTELREAYSTGNVNPLLAVFGDGFAERSNGQRPSTDPKPDLRQRLKKLFARFRAKLAITIISIRIQGPLAFYGGWHTLTLVPKKGGHTWWREPDTS